VRRNDVVLDSCLLVLWWSKLVAERMPCYGRNGRSWRYLSMNYYSNCAWFMALFDSKSERYGYWFLRWLGRGVGVSSGLPGGGIATTVVVFSRSKKSQDSRIYHNHTSLNSKHYCNPLFPNISWCWALMHHWHMEARGVLLILRKPAVAHAVVDPEPFIFRHNLNY